MISSRTVEAPSPVRVRKALMTTEEMCPVAQPGKR
jgi:hypothetical protein